MTDWGDKLPDISAWQPRDARERIANLFFRRCRHVEERILVRAKAERDGCVESFDSGPGVEDIIREELGLLLPARYSVRGGTVDDRYGRTCGDCDLIVFNDFWFPSVRPGATDQSRKIHFPIEGVYAVGEIKSTLSFKTLDEAMAKLVACHRLHRPTTPSNRIVENRWITGCPHKVANPLYSLIVGVRVAKGITFEDLVNRFFTICKELPRSDVVRALCVLKQGTVTWGVVRNGEIGLAKFDDDYHERLVPTFHRNEVVGSALYPLITDLIQNLTRMILSPEDLVVKYGLGKHTVSAPTTGDIALPPGTKPEVRDPEDPSGQYSTDHA
jgi:hypothetical protein